MTPSAIATESAPRTARARSFVIPALAASLGLAVLAASPQAKAADPAPTAPTSIAEQLFVEGRTLMQSKNYEAACEKFRASYALDVTAYGTLLNLALCHEATNKPASAWIEFRVVAAASLDKREDRYTLAREHEAKLFPRLSYLKLAVPEAARVAGLTLRIDGGSQLEQAVWNTELTIDPGPHAIEASAPGYLPKTIRVTIGDPADHKIATVPALEKVPPPKAAPIADGSEDSRSTRRTLGYILGGAGLVSLGVGLVFGLSANGSKNDAYDRCPNDLCASEADRQGASDSLSSADTSATISNVLTIAGGVFVVSGVVLYLTARSPSPTTDRASRVPTRTGPSVGFAPRGQGGTFVLGGSF